MQPNSKKRRLRILFVNRMAATERGGGETFDLEIACHLTQRGHEVTFLSNRPLFSRGLIDDGRKSNNKERGTKRDKRKTKNEERGKTKLRFVLLRSPMFPWFPWDRVKGGWRVRSAEFWIFEKLAARWAWRHRTEYDIIQVCELPVFVATLKRLQVAGCRLQVPEETKDQRLETGDLQSPLSAPRPPTSDPLQPSTCNFQPATLNLYPKLILRLTAPNVHDPAGGIQLADAVIASGTSIGKIRRQLRPDCCDVPNGVDLRKFQVSGCRLQVEEETIDQRLETGDWRLETTNNEPRTTNNDEQTTNNDERTTKNEIRRTKNDERKTLLYVARFQSFKNHALLLRALRRVVAEMPEVVLKLAGSGPLRGRMQDLVQSLGVTDSVHFLGEVAYDDLPEIYARAGVKVISSEYESFCFAAIEAMACGLPIVTTDCGWVPKLIGDELAPIEKQYVDARPEPGGRFEQDVDGCRIRVVPGGRVVGRTDEKSLAAAIMEMIRDPELREKCGRWNRAKAEREHGWEASAKKLEAIYLGVRTAE